MIDRRVFGTFSCRGRVLQEFGISAVPMMQRRGVFEAMLLYSTEEGQNRARSPKPRRVGRAVSPTICPRGSCIWAPKQTVQETLPHMILQRFCIPGDPNLRSDFLSRILGPTPTAVRWPQLPKRHSSLVSCSVVSFMRLPRPSPSLLQLEGSQFRFGGRVDGSCCCQI